jgi:protoporphyrinogen oxidase
MTLAEKQPSVVIIGAGPAGLTAAYELVKHGRMPLVLEMDRRVGGIARTEVYRCYRFDIGGHRFYTKVGEVEQLWHAWLGEDFRSTPRLSRIYYQHKFFPYPLQLGATLRQLGPVESIRIGLSYLRARLFPIRPEESFAQWVTNRFGFRLYSIFFKTYTEKVWGISCDEIRADWAAQRIRGLSLPVAVLNALTAGWVETKSLIQTFHYPVYGPGMMWEACQAAVEQQGGEVRLETAVTAIHQDGAAITALTTTRHGQEEVIPVCDLISTMPLSALVRRLTPAAPPEVLAAADALKYRSLILVGLILEQTDLFPDTWIYVHAPGVRVGRIQNFNNWSPAMTPDSRHTSLGMEYFCDEGDALWAMADADLLALAAREIGQLGLADPARLLDGVVIRQPKAYPVYDSDYQRHLRVLRDYVARFGNLQTVGRNGMHRCNNQDHSMLTGLLAARNLLGEQHDLWEVNTERSYYETVTLPRRAGHRATHGETS